ncbi:uncharacterized protein B0H18DRAFT_329848 [Fomitopsis serialis]|uniref:uncharacterized protein n=1 Tax=Fomitopsis serialis TaxID=139415 RepID=UPI0020076A4B|nr:uncharacterized protein B0H18DRAFT_329848 [Neoantrodia serialis]KAH9926678.1 hypothetical protein B0H18DRAFT_329848 [Neoantrodia serialis]
MHSGAGDRFTGIVGDAFAGMGNMVSDSIHGGVGEAFTGVFGGIGDMASDAAWFMYDTSRRFIPVTTADADPVPLLPDAFVDDPGDPYAALLTGFQEDVRKWSTTTDIIVPPIFDLADWTTDLIVRPPGDIIVWVPQTLRTCLWAERPRRNTSPPEIEDSSSASTSETPYAVKIARTVVEGFQDRHHAGSRRAAHALVLFYTVVIAYVAVATLEPVRTAWRTSLVGHLGLPAIFGFVMRSLYSSMLFMASLKGMPADDHVQRMADLTRQTVRQLRRAASQDHALISGPRPLIAYDLANYTPAPRLALRPLLVVFRDGPVPIPVAIPRSATRSRTFSAMTFMEARQAAPSGSGPLTMTSIIEEDVPATTMRYAKRLLRRQQPGLELFGLWKRRVHRHAELRALRDEMGEDTALRHAQEGRKILQQNLRSMWAAGGRLERASVDSVQ